MQGSDAGKMRDPRVPRIPPTVALIFWAAGALVFAALPQGSGAKPADRHDLLPVRGGLRRRSVPAGRRRAPAVTSGLSCGSWERVWSSGSRGTPCGAPRNSSGSRSPRPVAPQDVAYAISYPLLVGAMLHLVALATRRITLVSALDAGAVMLSVGTLAWYFVLGPAAAEAGLASVREAAVALIPAGLRRSPALPRARGRLVPDQAPFLRALERGFRRAAARRRCLPGSPLGGALRERQLARDAVGSGHDPARPRLDDIARGPRRPEYRANTAVAGNPVLARSALPTSPLRDLAPLGRPEPAAAGVRTRGMRRAPPVHGHACRVSLISQQTSGLGQGGIGPPEGAGPPALRATRHRKAGRARHLADAPLRPRRRAPRRSRERRGRCSRGP